MKFILLSARKFLRIFFLIPFHMFSTAISLFKTKNTYVRIHSYYSLNNQQNRSVFNKTIWLLWLQGWDHAPWLVKQVADSWVYKNPDWKVVFLDHNSIRNYIKLDFLSSKNISDQAKSDIIRLRLLAAHGGVWADATLLCMQPLNSWLDFAIAQTGFWMYHGNGANLSILQGPASWFIVSTKDSYIIKTWNQKSESFWSSNNSNYNYFWMDYLFKDLLKTDAIFAKEWSRVPYISCELFGQAHCLRDRNFLSDKNLRLFKHIKNSPPFVIKLSWKLWNAFFPDISILECKNSIGYRIISLALSK